MTLQLHMELRIHVTLRDPMEPKVDWEIVGLHGILETVLARQGLIELRGSAGPWGSKETTGTLQGLMEARASGTQPGLVQPRGHCDPEEPNGTKGPM